MKISTIAKLSAAPLALSVALAASPALAQTTENTAVVADDEGIEEAFDPGDRIVVTGSRIQTAQVETVAPVVVVGEESIEATGAINIQETLLRNPVFGTPSLSRTNTSFSTSATGISTVDLRNLGVDRTLVLMDGRRIVSGLPGSSAVDHNMVPTALIERVDILTSGSGSAIYGSDAVAGVVNFIMKDDFEGVELEFSGGITEIGDSEEFSTSLTFGSNFADGRGNAVFHAGYTYEGTALLRDHYTEAGRSSEDSLSAIQLGTGPFSERLSPFYSSYNPGGTFFTENYSFTYFPTGELQGCTTTNGLTCTSPDGVYSGVGPTGFNRTAYRYLAAPTERVLMSAMANYEVAPAVEFFAQGSYATTGVTSNIEPFPFASDNVYDDGTVPVETFYTDPDTGLVSVVRNPFVPDAIYNDTIDTPIYDTDGDGEFDTGDGLRDIGFVTKRLTDFGDRRSNADRTTFRIVTGLRGEWAPSWDYEVFLNYGKTSQTQLGNGQINTPNLREALKIVPDGDGGFQCADPNAVANGCVPANIFGINSITGDSLQWLAAPTTFNAKVSQIQIGAFTGGELFSIMADADPIVVSVGAEYRREKSSDIWDVLSQTGQNAGNALPPTSGSFDVKEVYGELQVPLIQDGFIHDSLVRGAARYSDYSTVGGTFSWNAGIEIAPIEAIRFRAMYSETVRAPNISELYAGLSQTFPSLTDPCKNVTQDGSALATNCFADVGVQNNAAANGGTFTLNGTSDVQGVTGFDGGNPNLNEETGKTWTAGVVIDPGQFGLNGLTLAVDYFNVKIDDAIVLTPRQFILNQCYVESQSEFCDFIIRRPNQQGPYSAGSLDEVNTGPSNSGGEKAEGIDVKLSYNTDLSFLADAGFSFSLLYTRLLEQYSDPLPGAPRDFIKGEVGASKDRFTAQTFFDWNDLRFAVTGTYIGPAYLDDQLTGEKAYENDDYRLHDELYVDMQARYTFLDTHEVYVGVDNVFDNNPIYTGGLITTGMETDTGTYDPLGRRFYAGVKFGF